MPETDILSQKQILLKARNRYCQLLETGIAHTRESIAHKAGWGKSVTYGRSLGIAGEDGFMGGIAVMNLLCQDLLLPMADTHWYLVHIWFTIVLMPINDTHWHLVHTFYAHSEHTVQVFGANCITPKRKSDSESKSTTIQYRTTSD